MADYNVNIVQTSKATIDSNQIAKILREELEQYLGYDRFILNGKIMERDYHFNFPIVIRDATDEEIELFEAFLLVESYFRNLS